jgi:hypothetical protein
VHLSELLNLGLWLIPLHNRISFPVPSFVSIESRVYGAVSHNTRYNAIETLILSQENVLSG